VWKWGKQRVLLLLVLMVLQGAGSKKYFSRGRAASLPEQDVAVENRSVQNRLGWLEEVVGIAQSGSH
jgi:hypothetical protein